MDEWIWGICTYERGMALFCSFGACMGAWEHGSMVA